MENFISKCYARTTDVKPGNGMLWYLPHHGVKHPKVNRKSLEWFSTTVPIMEDLE